MSKKSKPPRGRPNLNGLRRLALMAQLGVNARRLRDNAKRRARLDAAIAREAPLAVLAELHPELREGLGPKLQGRGYEPGQRLEIISDHIVSRARELGLLDELKAIAGEQAAGHTSERH